MSPGVDGHVDRHGRGGNEFVPGGVGRGAGVQLTSVPVCSRAFEPCDGAADADPERSVTGPGVTAGGRLGPRPGDLGELRTGGGVAGPVGAGFGVGGGGGRNRGTRHRDTRSGREGECSGGAIVSSSSWPRLCGHSVSAGPWWLSGSSAEAEGMLGTDEVGHAATERPARAHGAHDAVARNSADTLIGLSSPGRPAGRARLRRPTRPEPTRTPPPAWPPRVPGERDRSRARRCHVPRPAEADIRRADASLERLTFAYEHHDV